MNTFYLIADESGAKGYSGTPEKFKGEAGIFAGIIFPLSLLKTLSKSAKVLRTQYAHAQSSTLLTLTQDVKKNYGRNL